MRAPLGPVTARRRPRVGSGSSPQVAPRQTTEDEPQYRSDSRVRQFGAACDLADADVDLAADFDVHMVVVVVVILDADDGVTVVGFVASCSGDPSASPAGCSPNISCNDARICRLRSSGRRSRSSSTSRRAPPAAGPPGATTSTGVAYESRSVPPRRSARCWIWWIVRMLRFVPSNCSASGPCFAGSPGRAGRAPTVRPEPSAHIDQRAS